MGIDGISTTSITLTTLITLTSASQKCFAANARGMTVSYYREKREVNIVLHSRDTVIPVEVKYQSTISETDHKNLIAFMEEFKIDKGVLVTRDLLATHEINGKDIRIIPAWLFLMMLS